VHPVASAVDLVKRSRREWTIDFGQMPLEQAALYELPFAYVKEHVYPIRMEGRKAQYAGQWWQYVQRHLDWLWHTFRAEGKVNSPRRTLPNCSVTC